MITHIEKAIWPDQWLGKDRHDGVLAWAKEIGVSIDGGNITTHPLTFDNTRTWYFESEADKLLFLLTWSNRK